MCQLITTIWKPCDHRRERHFRLYCLSFAQFRVCPTGNIEVGIKRPADGSSNAQVGIPCSRGFCPDCLTEKLSALYKVEQQ